MTFLMAILPVFLGQHISRNQNPLCVLWMVPNQGRRGELCLNRSGHEPFCTVLPEQVSESIGVSRRTSARLTKRPDLPSLKQAGRRRSHVAREQERVGWDGFHADLKRTRLNCSH